MKNILTRATWLLAVLLAACNRDASPIASNAASNGSEAATPRTNSPDTARGADTSAQTTPASPPPSLPLDASSDASGESALGLVGPKPVADVDAGALPQTHDKPVADAALESRARALVDAIAHDDPERGIPFFFPVAAYEQVKAIQHPASDWRRRLVGNYSRDIHALSRELGTELQFQRIEVPKTARWVEPNEEYNRIGYYRVYGAQILCTTKGGRERAIRISSMISWRGEWYVVHLTGFK